MTGRRLIAAVLATVAVTGGVGVVLLDDGGTARAAVRHTAAPLAELDCQDTAVKYKDNDKLYLYGRSYCKGANDAWDDGNDSDYGDGKGKIKAFDNKADSIVNTTDRNIAFYSLPHYQGDSFCVRPGNYVRRLYLYGDGSGTNDWWSNSISSHRLVDAKDCDRWFGWLIE